MMTYDDSLLAFGDLSFWHSLLLMFSVGWGLGALAGVGVGVGVVQKDINSCCGARLVQELELGSLLLFFFCVSDIGLD